MDNKTFDIEITQEYTGTQVSVSLFINRVNTKFLTKNTLFIDTNQKVRSYKNNELYLEKLKNKNPDYKLVVLVPKENKPKRLKVLNNEFYRKKEQLELGLINNKSSKEVGRKHLDNIKKILKSI